MKEITFVEKVAQNGLLFTFKKIFTQAGRNRYCWLTFTNKETEA
jgi:hypothetical protein